MEQTQVDIAVALAVALTLACVVAFPYLTITGWARERRREREALYRYDVLKKLAEDPACAALVVNSIAEHVAEAERSRRQAIELSGWAILAGGAALALALAVLPVGNAWLLGAVPAAVGVTLVAYARRALQTPRG